MKYIATHIRHLLHTTLEFFFLFFVYPIVSLEDLTSVGPLQINPVSQQTLPWSYFLPSFGVLKRQVEASLVHKMLQLGLNQPHTINLRQHELILRPIWEETKVFN